MVVRIVIAGESNCEKFAQVTLVADHLSQSLPNFCYERVEKSLADWKEKVLMKEKIMEIAQKIRKFKIMTSKAEQSSPGQLVLVKNARNINAIAMFCKNQFKPWLSKMNQKYKWHHVGSPLVWKELLMKGSKPYYIGGLSDFLDYCYSYYEFDYFLADSKFKALPETCNQYRSRMKSDNNNIKLKSTNEDKMLESLPKSDFVVCISGSGFEIIKHILSQLMDLSVGNRSISNIFIYDRDSTLAQQMEFIENDCGYIESNYVGRVVKYVTKIGTALSNCDLLIVLDHVPFNENIPIGNWLKENRCIMKELALMLNASASRDIRILLPNLGPACYNASILMNSSNIRKTNIVVATSDLGLEVTPIVAGIAEIPTRNMFCPPVWGFVGINHLVDIGTTIHKYNKFEPYKRYTKVKNSTLNIGSLTPEMRTLEYLMFFDNNLWTKVLERRKLALSVQLPINKAASLTNVVKNWLFEPNPDDVICLGIKCDGSFGLTFDGNFSQPARCVNGNWIPASNFLLPRDHEMKLPYLEEMARFCMKIKREELPKILFYTPCVCAKFDPKRKTNREKN